MEIRRVGGEVGGPGESGGHDEEADHDDAACAEALGPAGTEERCKEEPARSGQHRDTRLQRRIALDQLQELRQEEHHAHERAVHQGDGDDRDGEDTVAEELHGQQGPWRSPLPPHEGGEEDDRGDRRRDRHRRDALIRYLDDSHDEGNEADGREHRTQRVEPWLARIARLGHERERGDECEDDEGWIDPEDRVPGRVLQEESAHDRSDGYGGAGDRGPDADRLRPRAGLGEDLHEDRERRRHDEGSADTHDRATDNEAIRRRREACSKRSRTEDAESDDERAPAAEAVSETAREQERAGEEHRVGIHHPLKLRRSRTKLLLQGRQGDVDDRVVQRDDGERSREDGEDRPGRP